jgi:hypothetical protein
MSLLPPSPDAQLYARVRRAFDAPAPPVRFLAPFYDVAGLERRLRGLGVDYCLDGPLRALQCGPVRLVSCCAAGDDPAKVARFAAAVARVYECTRPFTVILALVEHPLMLAHDRPLTRKDINSGATWIDERLTVMWRWCPDFYKVLAHELDHLINANEDEAAVEARALRLMCMRSARTYGEYRTALAAQQLRMRALSHELETVDVGDTNASLYWQQGACLLDGGTACEAARKGAASGEGGEHPFRVLRAAERDRAGV